MTTFLRPIADPFVAAAPAGVRVRTRLRVSAQDEAVLWAAGRHLGSLAGRDLAAAGLTETQWRVQWESARLFLTADGEKDTAGNQAAHDRSEPPATQDYLLAQ